VITRHYHAPLSPREGVPETLSPGGRGQGEEE